MEEQNYNISCLLILMILISSFRFSVPQADKNYYKAGGCPEFENPILPKEAYKSLEDLLNLLSKSVTTHNNFYKTSIAGKVYGFIQCRADVSASNCSNCTENSINIARTICPNKTGTFYSRWCVLHLEDKDFTGKELEDDGTIFSDTFNVSTDNTYAIAKGQALMGELSRNTSNEPLMFKVGVVDVGKYGKRYGMAECYRDLTRNDCAKCLDKLLTNSIVTDFIVNNRGWEFSLGCGMWYDDYKFYSDIVVSDQTPVSSGNRRSWLGVFSILLSVSLFLY